MIVLDESIYDERLAESISHWYSGTVVSILALRPATLIKDEAIPMLLRRAIQPTFLTINVTDFWQVMASNGGYCIIAIPITQGDSLLAGDWLRRCLRMAEFSSKANRMGKVILLRPSHIEYYSRDRKVFRLDWVQAT